MESTITEEREGVQVQKYLEDTEFEHPSIVYEFQSLRVEPVTVTVIEALPEPLDPTDIGFHLEHGSDHWQLDDESMEFEYELDGDAEYRTVYTVKAESPVETAELLSPPAEFSVDPPVELTRGGSSSSCSTKSQTGNGTAGTDGTQPATPALDERHNSPSLSESDDSDTGPPVAETETGAVDATDTDHSLEDEEPLLERAVAEIEAGDVSDATLQSFSEALYEEQYPRSVDARVKQLQADVADLRAYTEALEAFLDDHGSADEVIDRFEARMDSFEDTVNSLESTDETQGKVLATHHQEIQDMQERLETMSTDIATVEDEVAGISTDVADLDTKLNEYDIDTRLTAIEQELDEIATLQENLKSVFQS